MEELIFNIAESWGYIFPYRPSSTGRIQYPYLDKMRAIFDPISRFESQFEQYVILNKYYDNDFIINLIDD